MGPEFYYRNHKNPTFVPILSQMNPVHVLLPYSYKIFFHITLQLTHGSSKLLLPLK